MLNRSILTELATLEARFEAGCVVYIDLIDSCDNVVRHFLGFIPVGGSLYVWYVFSGRGGGMGEVERLFCASITYFYKHRRKC